MRPLLALNSLRGVNLLLAGSLLLAVAGCGSSQESPLGGAGKQKNGASDVSAVSVILVDYDAVQKQIAGQRGKVVVVDGWSLSCEPCLKEFHNLVDLDKRYGDDDLTCLSLSFDYEGGGSPEEVRPRVLDFLRSQRATFTNMLGAEGADVLYRKFRLASVPAVWVYDRRGRLRRRFDNEHARIAALKFNYRQVGDLVAQLVAEPKPGVQAQAAPSASSRRNVR